MNKKIFKHALSIILILSILISTILVADVAFAKDNAPKGFEPYYMRGYTFNVPESFKQTDSGYDNVNHLNYMDFKKGSKFVNISLDRHSSFTKNQMDIYSLFTWNGLDHYKTSIAGVSGFYVKKNGVKSFVFSSEDDTIYIKAKGVKLSKVLSSISQKNYHATNDREYDFDDDAYYESDVYDDSFDDSFDDASYYNYNWWLIFQSFLKFHFSINF